MNGGLCDGVGDPSAGPPGGTGPLQAESAGGAESSQQDGYAYQQAHGQVVQASSRCEKRHYEIRTAFMI